LVSIGVAIAYGAMVLGVLPSQPGISWESHLFGALVGLGYAVRSG
jgi:membrane associated rhomboid family serine protease